MKFYIYYPNTDKIFTVKYSEDEARYFASIIGGRYTRV